MNLACRQHQRGAVLILMFVSMVLTVLAVVLAAVNNRNPSLQHSRFTTEEMQRVKELLLGYAMSESLLYGGPGRLPCPDVNNAGEVCNNVVQPRRLPRLVTLPSGDTLQISDRLAAVDEQYWYAVTQAFKRNSSNLNTTTAGLFSIDGVPGYAAVLIAPGPPLTGQVRPHNSQANRYLESANVTGPDFVTSGTSPDSFNDRVLGITVKEVMTVATIRVAQEVRRIMDLYYTANSNQYPADMTQFQAAMSNGAFSPAAWLAGDNWLGGTFAYTRAASDQATIQFESCNIVYTIQNNQPGISRSVTSC